MFMELYYKNYRQQYLGRYWEEPQSLPFAVFIHDKKKRKIFECILLRDGFDCVVEENDFTCMYVNFTLKRYGRSVRACYSTSINNHPFGLEEFMNKVYLPWQQNPQVKEMLENNYVLSAQILLRQAEKTLEENIRAGRANESYIRLEENSIAEYKRYLNENLFPNSLPL